MMAELEGKVALVTGAGRMRGTGHSIAVALAQAGCDVVVHGSGSAPETWPQSERDAGWRGLEDVADKVRGLGRRALVATADLGQVDQVEAMFAKIKDEFGRLDILVNNAAAPRGPDRKAVVDLPDSEWRKVLATKLDGGFYCARAAARMMVAQGEGGSIVNISSTGGKQGAAQTSAYAIANAGLQMLGAVMARELGPEGITVNSLCLGYIDTSRVDDLGRGEAWTQHLKKTIPLGRAGTPQEVGEVVVFLCSPAGKYISGQSINVCGGLITY
jgi:NAD(P)-dependent dehydrogenase (short-subunit alcohol dehydrogenase family)